MTDRRGGGSSQVDRSAPGDPGGGRRRDGDSLGRGDPLDHGDPRGSGDVLRRGDLIPLAAGVVGVVAGTLLGWDARLVAAVVAPPAFFRAVLVGAAAVLAAWLLRGAVLRIELAREGGPSAPARVVRGVRFAFLGVAAFAAAIGWLVGHPLPLVLALVIAGIDVVETTFLLLVLGTRRGQPHEPEVPSAARGDAILPGSADPPAT